MDTEVVTTSICTSFFGKSEIEAPPFNLASVPTVMDPIGRFEKHVMLGRRHDPPLLTKEDSDEGTVNAV